MPWRAVLCLFVGVVIAGCAHPAPPQPQRTTLRLGIRETIEARLVFAPILFAERLIAIGWNGRPQPALATDWEWQEDGRALTVHLRQGVTFHDGSPFTAPVVADILRYSQAHDRRRAFASVADFKIVDDHTIVIGLSQPDVFLVEALADTWMIDVKKPDIGTGPFKLLTRAPTITAEKNGKYFLGTPGMDRVEVITYETPRAAWVASMRGEIDMIQEVNRDSAEFLEGSSHIDLSSVTRPFYIPLVFNVRHPVLRKVEVRRALAEAINREEIVQQAMGGHGRVADDPVWPFNWAYNAAARRYAYNPNAARLRLDAAGFPMRPPVHGRMASRFSIRCLFWNDPQFERMALLLQRQLADVGVDLILEASPETDLQERAGTGNFETFLYQLTSGKSFNWTYRFWHTPTVGAAAYQDSGYTGVDSVLERLRTVRLDAEIRTAVADLRERFYQDVPAAFLAWPETTRAIDARFDVGDGSDPDVFANLWKWRPAERQAAAR